MRQFLVFVVCEYECKQYIAVYVCVGVMASDDGLKNLFPTGEQLDLLNEFLVQFAV